MNLKQTVKTWGWTGALAFVLVPATHAQAQPAAATTQQRPAVQSKANAKAPQPIYNAVCPVSGEPIGSMGEGVNVNYKNSIVTLCCKSCANEFNANPEAYLRKAMAGKKLDSRAQGQKKATAKTTSTTQELAKVKDLKNSNCPVSGEAVGSMGEGVVVFHNGYKVTLCCAGCKERFEANPDQYLKAAMADTKRP